MEVAQQQYRGYGRIMKKFSVYLDADEIDYIVAEVLEEQIANLQGISDVPIYSYDPEEERKAVKKAIKAYKFVLEEFS